MVAAAVGVALVVLWLASRRLEFKWRISWLLVAFGLVCASGPSAGVHRAGGIAEGIYTAVHGVGSFLSKM